MKKKYNVLRKLEIILFYSVVAFIILLPLQTYIQNIAYSLIIGFTWSMLNELITQLRMLNGEKFENL